MTFSVEVETLITKSKPSREFRRFNGGKLRVKRVVGSVTDDKCLVQSRKVDSITNEEFGCFT